MEQRETKGQRWSQRESVTRSTKHLRDARPLIYFYKTAHCHAHIHTHIHTNSSSISVCNETWQWPKEDCLRRSAWQLLLPILTQDRVNASPTAWIFYQEYDLLFLLQTPHYCSALQHPYKINLIRVQSTGELFTSHTTGPCSIFRL